MILRDLSANDVQIIIATLILNTSCIPGYFTEFRREFILHSFVENVLKWL